MPSHDCDVLGALPLHSVVLYPPEHKRAFRLACQHDTFNFGFHSHLSLCHLSAPVIILSAQAVTSFPVAKPPHKQVALRTNQSPCPCQINQCLGFTTIWSPCHNIIRPQSWTEVADRATWQCCVPHVSFCGSRFPLHFLLSILREPTNPPVCLFWMTLRSVFCVAKPRLCYHESPSGWDRK